VIGSRVRLSCGQTIIGKPHHTEAYRQTAKRLGYDDDITLMCAEHDPLHQGLARWLGIEDSHSLREAAGLPCDHNVALAEEDAVMAVQRYMRLAGGRLPESGGP
jgi:hypothetical protein